MGDREQTSALWGQSSAVTPHSPGCRAQAGKRPPQGGPSHAALAGRHLSGQLVPLRGGPHLPRVGTHRCQLLWQVGAAARKGDGEGPQEGAPNLFTPPPPPPRFPQLPQSHFSVTLGPH